MYITYLPFALLPFLPQLAKAHDPRNRLCDLIALPLSPECSTLTECQAILSSNCQDDTCACAYSAKAEACVNCMASDDSVNKYNDYLGACVSLSQAAPTTLHTVFPSVASAAVQPAILSSATPAVQGPAVDGQFTDITAAMGVETQVAGSADLEHPAGTVPVVVGSAVPAVSSASVYRGIGGQTQAQGQPGVATALPALANGGGAASAQAGAANALPAPLNVGGAASALPIPLNAAAVGGALDPHGINVINDTTASPRTATLVNNSITALKSTHNFFSQAISQACVQHCVKWKTQADMCSDDRCLCTPDVICAASDCSACVGDSGRGGQIGTCYSEFKNACDTQVVATTCPVASLGGKGTLTDQLGASGVAGVPAAGIPTAASQRRPAGAQNSLPYGYGAAGASGGTGQIQPMLVSDTMGVTYSITGTGLTTRIVTATAGAMIAQETIIVDAGAGALKVPGVTMMLCSLLGIMLACL